MARQPQVVIYIHSNQDESRWLRDFLTQRGVAFVEKDAWNSPLVRRELMVMGYQATPVTLIDGAAIHGFQPEHLARELDLRSNSLNPPGQEPR